MKQGWEYKKLGELGRVITGSTPSTKDVKNYETNDVCFIKPSDISGNGIDYLKNSEYYISEYAYNNSRQLPKGSVLTTCIGIIGKVAILEIDATCNQQINAIVPNNDIDSKFLAYSIISQRYLMQSMANAPVVPLLNKTQFSGFQIPVPPLTTQQSIVSELDTLSQIIADYKEQLADYDKLEQSIFYDMFGDPVKNEKGWEVKKLGEVATSELGKMLDNKKNTGKTRKYLCTINVLWEGIDLTTIKEMKIEDDDVERYSVKKGDLLICEGGDTGRCAIWENDDTICYQNSLHRVRFDNALMLAIVCKNIFKIYKRDGVIENYSKGQTIKHLVKNSLLTIPLPIPPLPLQQQFASKIESIEQMKADTKAALQDAELLFQSRMDYWFN